MLSPVELIFVAVVIWGTVFWLSMLLDCWRNEPKGLTRIIWTVVIALTHVVGALLYLLARRPDRIRSQPRGSRSSKPSRTDGKRRSSYAFALPLLLLGAGPVLAVQSPPAATPAPAQAPALSEAELYSRAEAFVAAVSEGKAADVGAALNEEMRQAMPSPSALTEAWRGMEQQAGPYKGIEKRRLIEESPHRVVTFDTAFGEFGVTLRIPFDAAGKVAGFWFAPRAPAAPTVTPAPAYADPAKFEEQEVTVGSGEWALPGTLTLPKGAGPFPAVVLVHGSGPQDRDETTGAAKPFRDLAQGLATRGIAVLRYDNRTKVHGAKLAPVLSTLTVREEATDDARAAADLLRKTPKIDPARVYLLGHSLGAMLAPRIAAQDPGLAGVILLAPPARPLEDLLAGQYSHLFSLSGEVSAEEKAQLDRLREQVARVKSPELTAQTPASDLPLGLPASYWLDLRGYDPVATAKKLDRPLLILQGGRDYQVTPADDFERWKAAFPQGSKTRLQLFPKLDHGFREGEGASKPDDAQKPGNVPEEVVKVIAEWVLGEGR
ncbi:MAG TPA: alpha/beta fold hydrolase [Thermoanaerobaculia bacterium]|nr:alpha/beta fold hydrolase [Thermoanaerobaculia bacterium]